MINSDEPESAQTLEPPSNEDVQRVIDTALAEDLRLGPDVTTEATIAAEAIGTADIVARSPGVLAGLPIAEAVFATCAKRDGATLTTEALRADGDQLMAGDAVLTVTGRLQTILTAERTALNLLCQLSGVATLTARWVKRAESFGAKIRDTRKTVPGMRTLQKYAVRCGGGVNHRMALGDAALIKDNHIVGAGSVSAALARVRAAAPTIGIEVECDTIAQVDEAIAAGAELILLDNMNPLQLIEAVQHARGRGVRTEASGGLSLSEVGTVAATGVDYIAAGELTHSAPVLDLGLDLR